MKRVTILVLGLLGASSSHGLSLDEYLAQARVKHKGIQSLEASKSAASYRREAGDTVLSPMLTLKASSTDDKSPQNLGTFVTDRTQITEYSLGLGKKFSTGTNAQILASTSEYKISGADYSRTPPGAFAQTLGKGALGLSLSQSLWKDAFGNATRLRQERELQIERAERQSYDLQEQQLLIEAEAAYWDYLYQREELAQRQASLERARKIENWVRRRVSNGIGDEADVYNAQGLVAGRELQLLMAQDEILAGEKRVRDVLELKDGEALPVLTGDLGASRRLEQMSQGNSGRKIRLDSYLAVLEAKAKAISAEEVNDGYRPDLVLEGLYRTNSSEPTMTEATTNMTQTNKPTQSVALKLVWMLDGDVKHAARQTAKSEALAAALRQERKLLESESSWNEINRRHSELTKKINAARVSSEVQNRKAAAQRDKLSKGRAITSDVITAEQDAAEATLTLIKLRAEQRKLEAQGRLFVTMEE